jgi:murein L,D-transpeptidase YafK
MRIKIAFLLVFTVFITQSFSARLEKKVIDLAEKGKFVEAINILEKYISKHPDDKEAKDLLLSLYISRLSIEDLKGIQDKNKREILEEIKDQIDDVKDPYVWIFRGKFLEKKDIEEALKNYKKAVSYDPQNPFVLYKIGKLSTKSKNYYEVRNVYSSIVEKEIIKGIPENIVYLPPNNVVLVVDKSLQTLFVYKTDINGNLSLYRYYPSTTGQNFGEKNASGDKKTPRGIYFFTRFQNRYQLGNNPTYGEGAFVTDYPNLIDRILKKDGYGIWLHGSDIENRAMKPFQTQGCVVVENRKIQELKNFIKLKQTPIVIEDKVFFGKPRNDIKNTIMERLNLWKTSWEKKDIRTFFSLYDKDFRYGKNLRGTLRTFIPSKKRKILRKRKIEVSISDLKILYLKDGYKDKDLVITHFLQFYRGDSYRDYGIKKIYWVGKNNNFKIIGEEFIKLKTPKKKIPVLLVSNQPKKKYISKETKKVSKPVKVASYKVKKVPKVSASTTIDRFLKNWEYAWEKKKVKKFVSYYCDDFRWRKGGKTKWVQYKKKTILNKKYIKLDIKILKKRKLSSSKYEVIFKQKYISDRFQSTVNKKVILKRVKNNFCIYRERAI